MELGFLVFLWPIFSITKKVWKTWFCLETYGLRLKIYIINTLTNNKKKRGGNVY